MTKPFQFLDPGRLVDGDLELALLEKQSADPVKKYVPGYQFEMRRTATLQRMGIIRLRIGPTRVLRYAGHIGYEVDQEHRGHRYAARSCRLLLKLALAHGLRYVWLTVDPKNIASQKTCEIIGARYVDTVRIPKEHEMYRTESQCRRRYKMDVCRALSIPRGV